MIPPYEKTAADGFSGRVIYSVVPAFSILWKKRKKVVTVTAAARMSDTGSARNTANALFAKKFGKMKMRGISRMIFRRQAISRQIFA